MRWNYKDIKYSSILEPSKICMQQNQKWVTASPLKGHQNISDPKFQPYSIVKMKCKWIEPVSLIYGRNIDITPKLVESPLHLCRAKITQYE